jgi:small subunit ribosomal protein S4
MARYTGPVCRLCRREGTKLYLKGDRCYTEKCSVDRRTYAPGQHGQGRKRETEYGLQLREKQKVRRIYGVLESQFSKYFNMADRQKGVTGENLLSLLERRLDNVVYRLGFAVSRKEARQLVRHGHFRVSGVKVNIPSFLVRPGNVISVSEKSQNSLKFKELKEELAQKAIPAWLSLDPDKMEANVIALPTREDIDLPIQEQLIVEFYSR